MSADILLKKNLKDVTEIIFDGNHLDKKKSAE